MEVQKGMKCNPYKTLLSIDNYSEEFKFRLQDGQRSYKSIKGVCFTIILLTSLLFYGTMQLIKLVSYGDVDVLFSSKDSHFNSSYEFDGGLQVAFAVSAYDAERESIEDPSIGVMKPFFKMWGFDGGSTKFKEIPTRPCTEDELLNPEEGYGNFFNPQPYTSGDLAYYYKKLKCLETDKVKIQGDF